MEVYPIPTDEAEFAADERKAIIEFDGEGDGQVEESKAAMPLRATGRDGHNQGQEPRGV